DDEAAVALVRLVLAAQERGGHREERARDALLHLALRHESEEAALVVRPRGALLLVGIEELLRGRQERLVDVLGAADLAQEVAQVVLLREPGQLRDVVQPDVHEAPDARLPQPFEELFGGFLRETDCGDLHAGSSDGSRIERCLARLSLACSAASVSTEPSPRTCRTSTPRSRRTRERRRWRWHSEGSSSLHRSATR